MKEDEHDIQEEYALIRRVVAGETDLFRTLVLRYQDLVFGIIMRQVGNRAVAEDLFQEVFVRGFKHLGSFKNDSRFSTWLTRIALNQTSTYFSSTAYRQSKRAESFSVEKHDSATSDEEGINPEIQNRFQNAIAALSPKLRDVLVLCGIEGRSYDQASLDLGLPIGTIRSRLNAARLKMRELCADIFEEGSRG